MTVFTDTEPRSASREDGPSTATPRVVQNTEGRPVVVWEDRRATPRRDMTARVVVRCGETMSVGVSENVSEGGLFVASFDTYPPGTNLEVAFTVPGGAHEIVVRATVRRTREPRAAVAEVLPGMGLCFSGLDEPSRLAIARYVETARARRRG